MSSTAKLYAIANKRISSMKQIRTYIKRYAKPNYNQTTNKTDYNYPHIIRDDKTDRMKTIRKIGTKKLRNLLKKETNQLINNSLNENID